MVLIMRLYQPWLDLHIENLQHNCAVSYHIVKLLNTKEIQTTDQRRTILASFCLSLVQLLDQSLQLISLTGNNFPNEIELRKINKSYTNYYRYWINHYMSVYWANNGHPTGLFGLLSSNTNYELYPRYDKFDANNTVFTIWLIIWPLVH